MGRRADVKLKIGGASITEAMAAGGRLRWHMDANDGAVAPLLQRAIAQVHAGRPDAARALCEQALAAAPAGAGHPAIHQMLAVLCMQAADAPAARRHIQASLATRPDHLPSLKIAGDAARATGDWRDARRCYEQVLAQEPGRPDVALALADALLALHDAAACERVLADLVGRAPSLHDAWFRLSLVRQDLGDFDGAIDALHRVLALTPHHAEAEVNLGIVLQETGRIDDAMQAYGRAYRLREDTFGRIAHALSTPRVGRLWLDLDTLRAALRAAAA